MISTNYIRRNDYATAAPQDQFIVSLLKYHIQQALSNYAKPTNSEARALDVGCGSQPFRSDLEALHYSYTSLDAEQNSEDSVDIICLIDQPLLPETLKDKQFDFILCTEVMEHVAKVVEQGGHDERVVSAVTQGTGGCLEGVLPLVDRLAAIFRVTLLGEHSHNRRHWVVCHRRHRSSHFFA
jgi:hypothetical protein